MSLNRPGFLKSRRRRRRQLDHEKSPMKRSTVLLVRALLTVLVLAGVLTAFPLKSGFKPPTFVEGAVSDEEILAPFDFDVPKSSQELDLEQARAAEGVLPVFVPARRGQAFGPVLDRLNRERGSARRLRTMADSLGMHLTDATLSLLVSSDAGPVLVREARHLLEQARTGRLVSEADGELLRNYKGVRVRSPEGEETLPTNQVWDVDRLADRAWERGMERLGAQGADALSDLVRALARPNMAYDHAATETDRLAARAAVFTVRTTILKGERIVDANERITADQAVALEALQNAMLYRSAGGGFRAWLFPIVGRMLLVGVFIALVVLFMRAFRPKIWSDLGHLTLMTVVTVIILGLAGIVARSDLHEYGIPIPLAGVLVTMLVGAVPAVGLVLGLSALVGAVSGWGLAVTLLGAVGGTIACYSVRNVLHRMEFLSAIVPVSLGMLCALLGMFLVGPGAPWLTLLQDMGWVVSNAILSIGLAMFLLPLLEKAFNLASNITLLELSDLNRPIFRRMMLEANGTYHHSMIVGSLAESAAEKVGANPLLARVGGYYHDIGKIAKSGYFGENLRSGLRNPHERLTPHMSSLILESHVREGLEMAREIGLPKEVAAFIPEHQGTTLMQYFFTKAQEMDPEVEEKDYRYPGPRPQSRETALVMLADAAEATVRSLDDQSTKKIRGALTRLFEARIRDGQLDDCGLTMADLNRVRDSFAHVLNGVFHGRVKYQWQKKGGEEALGESKGTRVFHPELETAIGSREAPGEFAGSGQAGRQERRN
jgi:hypothetical protein